MTIPRRLREAMIETATARTRNVRPHSVEHFAILFVRVKTVVDESAKKASTLRAAKADGSLHIALHVGKHHRRSTAVFHERNDVADARGAEADNGRILRLIDHFIDASGLKTRIQLDSFAVLRE